MLLRHVRAFNPAWARSISNESAGARSATHGTPPDTMPLVHYVPVAHIQVKIGLKITCVAERPRGGALGI